VREILLAAVAGYLFAQLRFLMYRRALAHGQRIIAQDQVECERTLKQCYDQLFTDRPLHLRVDQGTLFLDYRSAQCPGPHEMMIAASAIQARQHLARYLADRIAETRFSRITIEP
jgi:hypothetical protein